MREIHPAEERETYSRSYASMLHLASGRHPDDARTRTIVDGPLEVSPEFAEMYAAHDVAWKPGPERKTFLHPEVGRLELDCEQLSATGNTQVLLVFTATPGTESAERLRLLGVIGHQRFADQGRGRRQRAIASALHPSGGLS